ncbi:MAG: hypothetical protein ACRDPY_08105 [Streptosporangiaceae bacterium]
MSRRPGGSGRGVNTNGIDVKATTTGLPSAAGTRVARGSFLNAATAAGPAPSTAAGPGAMEHLTLDPPVLP